MDQYVVMEANGDYAVYRTWAQTFTVESITAELAGNGFVVELVGSDLRGSPLVEGSEMIGLVARKC